MSHDDLKSYAKDSRKFLKLEDGESYVGFFVGHKKVPDRFRISEDPTATTFIYTFKDANGKMLEWTKNSGKIAEMMAAVPHGSGISITRIKKGEYLIKPLDVPMPAKLNDEQPPF